MDLQLLQYQFTLRQKMLTPLWHYGHDGKAYLGQILLPYKYIGGNDVILWLVMDLCIRPLVVGCIR
jgi:hypothetical protein